MKLGYRMSKEEWRDLLEILRNTDGVTLSKFAETDKEGLFVDYKYATFEYSNQFFYIQEELVDGFTITGYQKVSPYEKHQCTYPEMVGTLDDIIKFINKPRVIRPFKDTFNQRIYSDLYILRDGRTDLSRLTNELAGYREKDILAHLGRIEMTMNTKDYKVLRFWHENGQDRFDYEVKSKRITN